jgi:FAD/FMN-containing dehydrogenase
MTFASPFPLRQSVRTGCPFPQPFLITTLCGYRRKIHRMNRKSFLKRLAAIPIVSALWRFLPASMAASGPVRRVRPSNPEWPVPATWDKLSKEVGGRLIKVQSPLAACRGGPDSAACQEIIKNLQNPFYIGDEPGATQSTGWADGWISAPSAYCVAAKNTDDVIAAVNFARENNLRLVVKGGGHSYQGTSNAADSLLIWTRSMNKITLHDTFVAQGCGENEAPQPAVSIGSGAMWIDAYNAVTTNAGRYVQGGGCATVGVAGLVQSGGFGSFSKNYGMAAAGLLETEIVTADGTARIANACTNSDLFWAIKGGGGGSFGVVTRVTLRTRELPAFFGGCIATVKAASDGKFHKLIEYFMNFYRENLFNPHWGETVTFRPDNTLAIFLIFQGLNQQQVNDIWRPFFDWLHNSKSDYTIGPERLIGTLPARQWWDADFLKKNLPSLVLSDTRPGVPETHIWYAGNQGEVGKYWHGYESMWLPATLLENEEKSRLTDALFAAGRHWGVALHFNKGLAGAPPEAIAAARETATNPAVLSAFALAIIAGGGSPVYPGVPGHEPDLNAARRNACEIRKSMDELRKIVPDAGSYVSESNFFDQSWQQSFWGPNYARLRAIKEKYDPTGLFFVHHGVGSEEWSADGFTRSG